MKAQLQRFGRTVRRRLKAVVDTAAGWTTVALLRALRHTDRRRMANGSARVLRHVGPWLPEHRIGRRNLTAAFPEKSPAEIERILIGSWDNLGRVAAEFAHLDTLRVLDVERPGPADIVFDEQSADRFMAMRDADKPSLFFASHLANWEVPALVAAAYKLDAMLLYRPPSIRAISDAIVEIRAGCMGTLVPSVFDAPIRLARGLEAGRHVGMLVDQYDVRGIEVTFFGRTCKANPLIAQLARHLECPIRGVRVVRQPDGHHFWGELGEPIELPRDAQGGVDVARTMQVITSVVEGWVREHPEQWLWQHRRWR
jgi:Kdo2-lipid IVA lauroyltransferase/acyltransferase